MTRYEHCMQTLCRPPFVTCSALQAYKPFVWVFCASISLLSARHLLVEQNIHYPLQLYFNQLAVTAIILFRPRLGWQYVQKLSRGDLQLWNSMTRGTSLLFTSMCFTSLSTICMLQAILHFYNLPTLAMITLIALFSENLLLYITRAIPHTYAELLRIGLLTLVGAALLFGEYRLTVPNLSMSIMAMLLAGAARGLRKLVVKYYPEEVAENVVRTTLHVFPGALVGVAWIMVFETGHQAFALGVESIPLLTLNASASAVAMLLGKSTLLPMHSEVADTSSQTIDGPVDRIWDALTLALFTGLVGCYSTLLMGRSYTNTYQFFCFLLAMAYIGSSAYIGGSSIRLQYPWSGPGKYELISPLSTLLTENGNADSLMEQFHYPGVSALKSSSPNNKSSRHLLGITITTLWAAYGILNFTERQERRIPTLLDQDYVPELPLEVVLSMYKEPVDEVGKLINHLQSISALSDARITIYIKDREANNTYVKQQTGADHVITLPNIGREGETFLNHILNRWDNLARQTIFLQAGIHNPREFYTYMSNYYSRAQTGFLNLGWPGRLCDCENCSDRFGWQDNLRFIPQVYNQVYNSTLCKKVLLSYKGQFIVSAARIRGIGKAVYYDLWQAFADTNSWAHQPSYLQGRPDSMSAPDFGYTMERLWNLLFQCSSVDVAWKCPTLLSGWRLGGSIGDCQCFDM
ncbi:hypothetical protein BU24DRAFT_416233 [Aaosphaeria arxii CBS 175.79]|uniref:Uncharacterized protein n=1 Tax=Aaosphaeria arxii CBS 175.79 TaxID=1450172 RepID=A0A6A5Y5T7_9PLEO|nr:uncharacterized protein BU24DRAFT_416233 [Aaosphaeria arxii CBS 175.79]KAF2020563.1 hypothetical protein BU24DRAFT_416233 [Aaosphaeria arxii CBS 175.79]